MTKASKKSAAVAPALNALAACLDEMNGRYAQLEQASSFAEYVTSGLKAADEQTLTEPLLQRIVERVLGFPADQYFPQLGKSGLKPDLTPRDLIAHSFVLDAKGSDEILAHHVAQIRGYVDQRSLRHGRFVFKRGRIETGSVEGPPARLDLVEEIVAGRSIDDVRTLELPKDETTLARREAAISSEVTTLLAEGRRLVEEVERLVCGLYDVPADLTDAVVEHAVTRARAGTPDDGIASSSD